MRLLAALLLAAVVVQSVSSAAVGETAGRPRHGGGGLKLRDPATKQFVVKSPMPHDYLKPQDIPRNWDWRNVSGENFVSSSRNQHIPTYCGSCWTMATSSSMADRIRIARNSTFPDVEIPPQTLVYCIPGGCTGGDPDDVHAYIHKNGIGPDTCQNYVAEGDGYECSAMRRCQNCVPGAGGCFAVDKYPKFGISEYGNVLGVHAMKAEIFKRGPIACGVDSGPIYNWGFDPANKNAIFTQGSQALAIDHEIAVVGFGFDEATGLDYWIIRNSWGEYWGDNGFFRLKMGDNQLDIEGNACSWAVPTYPSTW